MFSSILELALILNSNSRTKTNSKSIGDSGISYHTTQVNCNTRIKHVWGKSQTVWLKKQPNISKYQKMFQSQALVPGIYLVHWDSGRPLWFLLSLLEADSEVSCSNTEFWWSFEASHMFPDNKWK